MKNKYLIFGVLFKDLDADPASPITPTNTGPFGAMEDAKGFADTWEEVEKIVLNSHCAYFNVIDLETGILSNGAIAKDAEGNYSLNVTQKIHFNDTAVCEEGAEFKV